MATAQAVAVQQPTYAELKAQLEHLQKQHAADGWKQVLSNNLTLKISEKGALSIYGLGKFPVTLYREQMTRLLGVGDEIAAYMLNHIEHLKVKPAKGEKEAAALDADVAKAGKSEGIELVPAPAPASVAAPSAAPSAEQAEKEIITDGEDGDDDLDNEQEGI